MFHFIKKVCRGKGKRETLETAKTLHTSPIGRLASFR